MIGQTISHYRIIAKLGQGGMGVVYKALDTKLNRTVALKFLSPQVVGDPAARARLVQEARAAAGLHHSGICTIHEIEHEAGHIFICMAYVEGETLQERIKAGPLEPHDALTILRQVAAGLRAAHTQGIVHRDIKPANIMITPQRRVIIMDFGLAKTSDATQLTRSGAMIGTAAYMSPEQVRGEAADQRSDIWSLGVILYEMLAGRLPFGGEVHHAVIHAILNSDPQPVTVARPGLPYKAEEILAKALAKRPGRRYQQIADLLDDLDELEGRLATHAGQERFLGLRRLLRRRRVAISGLLFALLILIGLAAVSRFYGREAAIKSLAVLPFTDLSPDSLEVYLADGMTDALIGELGRIGALRVVSWTSVRQYKETTKSVPQIARELGVDALIEAAVVRRGQNLLVSAKLIRAAPEEQLWNESIATDMRNVLTFYRDVAKRIAEQIEIELTPQEEHRLAEVREIDPRAYEAFLRGRQHMYDMVNYYRLTQAIAHFDEAIAWEPVYALAWASKAYVHGWICQWWGGNLRTAHCSAARQAALRAVALDDQLAEAHVAMGRVHLVEDIDFDAAEASFRRAMELDPGNATILREWGMFNVFAGRYEEALGIYTEALALDPLNDDLHLSKGYTLWAGGRFAEGIEFFQGMLGQFPGHTWALRELAWCYVGIGDHAAADSLKRLAGDTWMSAEYAKLGMRDLALAEIETRRDSTGTITPSVAASSFHSYLQIAATYAALGEIEQSYAMLEAMMSHAPHQIVDILSFHEFDYLRRERWFDDFLRRAGLSEGIIAVSQTLNRWSPQ